MHLVMFLDAIDHVSRIARILRQPQGNALCLGVGGSGRQSLTRLATFICEYSCFQVEIKKGYSVSDWREDVKTCLLRAGVQQHRLTFLFSDTQIVHEQMVEDINNLLNSGDLPNLYSADEMESIMSSCRSECQRKDCPHTRKYFCSVLDSCKEKYSSCSMHESSRRCVQKQTTHVPSSSQLLHNRLVYAMAR